MTLCKKGFSENNNLVLLLLSSISLPLSLQVLFVNWKNFKRVFTVNAKNAEGEGHISIDK